jgi:AraC-like DNA-binding protein
VPLLILRLEKVNRGEAGEQLRGDFLINDRQKPFDLEIVNKARKLFPLKPCHHLQRSNDYELARETMKIISENYYDSDLSLNDVAEKLHASPSKLSKVLNQQVGISFRKLLKQIRIEKAKLILSSHRFSIKEVAIRVGFSDRHYFSRSFKEVTGMNATEYEVTAEDLLLN